MRILVDGETLIKQRSGIGQYVLQLVRALKQFDEVEATGVALGRQVKQIEDFGDQGRASRGSTTRDLLKWSCSAALPLCREARRWWRTVSSRQAARDWSLLHEPNYVASRSSVPLVTTVCDMSYVRFPEFLPKDRVGWLRHHLRASLQRSRAIVTISQFSRNEILDIFPGLDQQRVFVTPLGVDLERFRPRTDDETLSQLRNRYNLPEQFSLFLGTLEPRKNLQGLLQAYAMLPPRVQQEVPLVLAGMNGWRSNHFRPLLKQLTAQGVVRPLGYVADADVPLLMRAASAFCFPSHYEGFGLPPLEAAACGTPVLCARASSLPEVMGDAAVYVDPNSAEDIACGLTRILEDKQLRRTLSQRGLERAKLFTWKSCARETLAAYRAAAGDQGD